MSRIAPLRRPGSAGFAAVAALVFLLASLAACGPSEEERTNAARAEAWAELEEAQAALNARRGELEQVRAQAAAPGEGEDAEALAARVEALDEEVGADGEALQQKLVNYINEAEWEIGGEMDEEQRAAFAMMSGEQMYLAQEYVVKGGDYRRAIDILEAARRNDPDNPDLAARIAEYQEARYVTAERLAEVKRGMTEAEVEGILGKPFHSYVRNFSDENVFAWFYPKDPEQHGSGAAVGVFFREGDRKVYRTDPNAVEGRTKKSRPRVAVPGGPSLTAEGRLVQNPRSCGCRAPASVSESRSGSGPTHQREDGFLAMPVVQVRDDESFENALRRFKRKCEKEGILTELKKRQHFEKPSVKRKRKVMQARKKMLRKLAEERRAGLA